MIQRGTGGDPTINGDSQGSGVPVPASARPFRLTRVGGGLAAIIAFFAVVGAILYFKPFSDGPPAGLPGLDVFAAGPFDIYEPGSITYFEEEHFYLVRFNDGAFMAVYDLAPPNQARVQDGDLEALECRVAVRDDEEMAGWLGTDRPEPGFDTTGFYDECTEVAWDVRGMHVRGSFDGHLDRFPVETIEEIVRVNLGHRRCLNEVSQENPCITTQ